MTTALLVLAAIGFVAGLTGYLRGQRNDTTGALLAVFAIIGCVGSTILLIVTVLS